MTMPAEGGQGLSEGTTTESGQGTEISTQPSDSDYANHFLSQIPENERNIVGKYVKQWDAGVTRRFQDINNRYKHYDDLGWDQDTTSQMAEIYRMLNEEPETLYERLGEHFGGQVNEQNQQEGQPSQEIQEFPPEIQSKFEQVDKLHTVVEALAQHFLDSQQSQQEMQEDSELNDYLEQLHEEFGDYDEDYVCMLLENGLDGAEAVMKWQQVIQEQINAASQATSGMIPTLSSSGGGAVPMPEQQNLGKVPSKDIVNMIKNVLGSVNQ